MCLLCLSVSVLSVRSYFGWEKPEIKNTKPPTECSMRSFFARHSHRSIFARHSLRSFLLRDPLRSFSRVNLNRATTQSCSEDHRAKLGTLGGVGFLSTVTAFATKATLASLAPTMAQSPLRQHRRPRPLLPLIDNVFRLVKLIVCSSFHEAFFLHATIWSINQSRLKRIFPTINQT